MTPCLGRFGPAPFLVLILPLLLSGTTEIVHEGGSDVLLEAIRKASLAEGRFEDQVVHALPAVKVADEKALDEARVKLEAMYAGARDEANEEGVVKTARWICILAFAAKRAGKRGILGKCRLVVWQEVCDLAGSALPSEEEAAVLAKNWEPFWEDLFLEVMADYAEKEGEGDEEGKARCLDQLELIADAERRAFSREGLSEKLTRFRDGIRKTETLTPERRAVKRDAEDSLVLAKTRVREKSYDLALSILTDKTIPLFEKIEDKRGLMRAYFLRVRAFDKLGRHASIRDELDRVLDLAAEVGDDGFAARCREYESDLTSRGITLARSPLLKPGNFGEVVTGKLQVRFGRVQETRPLPQAFHNIYFWPAFELAREPGEVKDVLKAKRLPFPPPSVYFLVWRGKSVKIANNATGKGGQRFRYGRTHPETNILTLSYWDEKAGRNAGIRYSLRAVEYASVRICGNTRDFPVDPCRLNLRLRANSHRVGKLEGKIVVLCDDNANGAFNDPGTAERGDLPLAHDLRFSGCDTIVVGSKAAAYSTLMGSLVRLGNAHYLLTQVPKSGITLAARPYKGPLGKIRVRYVGAGLTPLHLVVGTDTGGGKLGFINLGGERGPVDVPPGSYFLKWGLLCLGADPNRNARVEIWPGDRPDFVVEEGKTTELVLGGPFVFHTNVSVAGNTGELRTHALRIRGALGEEYRRFWPEPFLASFRIFDAGRRRIHQGKLRKHDDRSALPPDVGVKALEFAQSVRFDLPKGGVTGDLHAEFKGKNPFLGSFETRGWR
ncbi:MAG: hypothetical protein ACYS47_18175 [Planctomycetota bacterium]|jgi:hypothetical protein